MSAPKPASRTPTEVGELLDHARFAGLPALVALFTTLAMVFDGFDIQALAFAMPHLLSEWHLDRGQMAPVVAAGLLGMAFGALAIGALGDHLGRRRALIGCMLLITGGSLLCAFAHAPGQLATFRLIAGIGLGGTLPNATALMAEFAPRAMRNLILSITVVGVPIGGMIGAAICADVIPVYGWRVIFVAGAALPALLAMAMIVWLPESPRLLVSHPQRWGELARVLNRASPGRTFLPEGPFTMREHAQGKVGVGALFAPELRYDTLILWLIFASNVFAVYCFFSWLPAVLSAAGMPLKSAIHGSLAFNLGGVIGSILGALAMNRLGSRATLIACGVMAVLSNFAATLVSMTPDSLLLLLIVLGLVGAAINALQVGMYSVTAYIYPTRCRSSGLGWALGMARFGGILSSFAGRLFGGADADPSHFFRGIAIVMLVTLTGVVVLRNHMPAQGLGRANT